MLGVIAAGDAGQSNCENFDEYWAALPKKKNDEQNPAKSSIFRLD